MPKTGHDEASDIETIPCLMHLDVITLEFSHQESFIQTISKLSMVYHAVIHASELGYTYKIDPFIAINGPWSSPYTSI